MPQLAELRDHLFKMGRVILGYSGGVDSTFLAVVATDTLGPDRFLAVIGRSDSYPAVQWRGAVDMARQFSIPLFEVATDELADPRYRANSTDRCYFCKQELWHRLDSIAAGRGFDTIIDGTIVDDQGEHRPGARAGEETRVRSPLAELGWTKAAVRGSAEELGIPVWDAPAAPCLASRIRYGVEVTTDRLGQVERAESYLRSLGLAGDLRVRHLGDRGARIETTQESMAIARRYWGSIVATLTGMGFAAVALDPEGYRRGSLLSGIGTDQ